MAQIMKTEITIFALSSKSRKLEPLRDFITCHLKSALRKHDRPLSHNRPLGFCLFGIFSPTQRQILSSGPFGGLPA
jgi:hypothetical protein